MVQRLGLRRIFGSVSLLTAGFCVLFLIPKQELPHPRKVGTFESAQGVVRKRAQNGVQFVGLDNGQDVFEDDTLLTSTASLGTVKLAEGAMLQLDPNSKVEIKQRSHLSYRLDQGSIRIFIPESTMVKILGDQNQEYELLSTTKGGALIELSRSQSLPKFATVRVLRGKVRSVTKTEFDPTDILRATLDGGLALEKWTGLDLISQPYSGSETWLLPDGSLEFVLNRVPVEGRVLDLARDADFKKIFWSQPATTQRLQIPSTKLTAGFIYARVRIENNGTPALANIFQVYPDFPAELVSPLDTSILPADAGRKTKEVLFTWKDISHSLTYKFQVSTDKEFSKPLIDTTASKNSWPANLEQGTYFWRVQGENPRRAHSRWSRIFQFQIGPYSESPAPAQTVTSSSGKRAVDFGLGPSLEEMLPLQITPGKKSTVLLNWPKMPGAFGYEVVWTKEIGRQSRSFYTKSNSYRVLVSKVGKYHVQVRSIDRHFQPRSMLGPSSWVEVEPKAQRLAPVAHGTYVPSMPILEEAAKRKTAAVPRDLPLDPPALQNPEVGALFTMTEAEQPSFVFQWKDMPGGSRYQLQIAKDADFVDVVYRKNDIKTSQATVHDQLPEGRLYWRVRKLKGKKASDWTEPRMFEIYVQ